MKQQLFPISYSAGVYLRFIFAALLVSMPQLADLKAQPIIEKPAWLVGPQNARAYKKAESALSGDNPYRKLMAAIFYGARRNPRYVRPLGRELNLHLNQASAHFASTLNDPMIKSRLAWALGRIGHRKGVPYLIRALKSTSLIIQSRKKRIATLKEADRKEYERDKAARRGTKDSNTTNNEPMMRIRIPNVRPAPFLFSRKNGIPYGPDVYWSVSHSFKNLLDRNKHDDSFMVRRETYNYVNLIFHILDAVGEIYERDDNRMRYGNEPEAVAAYMDKTYYPFIRGAAAICLGRMGGKRPLQILIKRYAVETDPEVKARTAYAILLIDRALTKYHKELLKLLDSEKVNVRFAASVSLRNLEMSASLEALKAAYMIEDRVSIRRILRAAIYKSYRDRIFESR